MSNEAVVPASSQTVDVTRYTGAAEVDPLAIIEQRNKLLDRILEVAIRSTHPGQWKDLGGNPWPEGPACESMARRCAVSMTGITREKIQTSDDKGPFFIWVYRATFSLPGGRDIIEAEGTCSSRDSFLGTETGAGRALSDCDEGSMMKAALTNCRVNGICQLLGVRRMSWDRLKQLGLDRDSVGKVEYGAGTKGGGAGKSNGDVDLKFGKGKDKKLSEVGDDDVRWYMAAWQRDLADPEKSKYHANCKKNLEIAERLLASRANEKAGTTPPAAGSPSASPWQRIRALDITVSEDELKEIVKVTTKKASASALVDSDVELVAKALAERAASNKADIPF